MSHLPASLSGVPGAAARRGCAKPFTGFPCHRRRSAERDVLVLRSERSRIMGMAEASLILEAVT